MVCRTQPSLHRLTAANRPAVRRLRPHHLRRYSARRNQVTAADGATVTYETTTGGLSSGNIANDGTTAYTYDAANRLKSAGAITYAYDPLDRLYQENASLPRRFLYAGSQLIGEYDTAGAIQTRYVPGPGVDEPLAEYAGSAVTTPIFHVQDERGSIIARTTSTDLVGAPNAYDEYGVPAAGVTGRFQYTGQTRLVEFSYQDELASYPSFEQ